jgi:coproporphyrinogen III oxidase-like Fe-S oxidoreductase
MLGLRTKSGVPLALVDEHLGASWAALKLKPLLAAGLVVAEDQKIRVSPQGYFVLNGILNTLAV